MIIKMMQYRGERNLSLSGSRFYITTLPGGTKRFMKNIREVGPSPIGGLNSEHSQYKPTVLNTRTSLPGIWMSENVAVLSMYQGTY
jgi:hypothetical protein